MKKQKKTETDCKNTVATECATGARTDAIEPRASCVFYSSWHEAIGRLPQKDQLNAYKMILGYSLNFEEPEDDGSLSYMIFVMAKPSIESAEERYNESVERGKTGGRPSIIDKEKVLELSFKGMKPSEIARKLGYNRDSVKSIIYRNKGANANLNVNDNETDNENETVYETVTEKEDIIILSSSESAAPKTEDEDNLLERQRNFDFKSKLSSISNEYIRESIDKMITEIDTGVYSYIDKIKLLTDEFTSDAYQCDRKSVVTYANSKLAKRS